MNKKNIALPDIVDQTMLAHFLWTFHIGTMLADDYLALYLVLRAEVMQEIGASNG